MGDLSNYDVYKIEGISNITGYMFSIQEDTDEEPTYHYYMVTVDSNKKTTIHKLNNTIELISEMNINLIPVDMDSPELQNFIQLVESTIHMSPTNQAIKLTKKQ